MKIAVILAFSLCLIAYSAAQKKCCESDTTCDNAVECAAPTDTMCIVKWTEATPPVAEVKECGPKDTKAGDSDCVSDAPTGPCYCEAKDIATETHDCIKQGRDKFKNPSTVTPELFSCCEAKECAVPINCTTAAEIYCTWTTTAEGLMVGVKCAAAGNDKKCDANTVATACSCKNSAGMDKCNKGFVRGEWEIKPETGSSSTVPGNPTAPPPVETTEPNGSASVRATILTTVYPVITILGVALFSFSPA